VHSRKIVPQESCRSTGRVAQGFAALLRFLTYTPYKSKELRVEAGVHGEPCKG
jgi:hypothetical protein